MPRGAVLTQALEEWTRRCLELPGLRPGAAEPSEDADTRLRHLNEIVLRPLRKHAASHNSSVLFLSLPDRVVTLICSSLFLSDRIVLSHLARDFRSRLVNIPDIWCDIWLHNLLGEPCMPAALQELTRRSDPLPLHLALGLDDDTSGPILPILSVNLERLSSLTLMLHTHTAESECSSTGLWQSMLAAFLGPAPALTELRIRALEGVHFARTQLGFFWIIRRSPLHISPSFLAGHAPMLRSCTLEGVQLPSVPLGGAFNALTCFDIYLGHEGHLSDVARVLPMLPTLETLAIRAYTMDMTILHPNDQPARLVNLKNLLLRVYFLDSVSLLSRVLPLSTIRHFDLITRYPGPLIGAAYPRGFKTFVAGLSGYTISAVDETGAAATTVRMYEFVAFTPSTIAPLATVTSLALNELLWGDVMQFMPPLPAVTALHIRLGSCRDALNMALSFEGRDGIFQLEPGSPWRVSGLKELSISAPSTCKADTPLCTCRGPMSISLLDVTAFIRDNLAFEAAALARVRLSGFRIIDPDFCDVWKRLRACADDLDWVEQPDPIPHMDIPPFHDGLDLRAHFSGRNP